MVVVNVGCEDLQGLSAWGPVFAGQVVVSNANVCCLLHSDHAGIREVCEHLVWWWKMLGDKLVDLPERLTHTRSPRDP